MGLLNFRCSFLHSFHSWKNIATRLFTFYFSVKEMYDYITKDQSMRMKPEGGIRNANVPECCNHITCALKNGKKQVMKINSQLTVQFYSDIIITSYG